MFRDQDLVQIKTEWLEGNETGSEVYLVLGDESESGSVKIFPTWATGLKYPPINTVRGECLKLIGINK
jgi:hypothetical protein